MNPDDDLAWRVAARLVDDPEVTEGEVRVSVQNRVVILQGHVPTPEARMAASRRPVSGFFNGRYRRRRLACAFSPVSTRPGMPCGFPNS